MCACSSARAYRLPLDAEAGRVTLAPILAAAEASGYAAREEPDAVVVELDSVARIRFVVGAARYDMVVSVDEAAVPPSEVDRRFIDARAKGEEIWKRALASMDPKL